MKFSILGEFRVKGSKSTTLVFWRVDFEMFRTLVRPLERGVNLE